MSVREPTKALIKNLETSECITVPYNPNEYNSRSVVEMSRCREGRQFQTVSDPSFTVALVFDSYEKGTDVRDLTKPIAALQTPTVVTGQKSRPPICLFSWGGFEYKGMLETFEQHFTLFMPNGVPARCTLTLTFAATPTARQVVRDAGLDHCRKYAIVRSGDRLDVVAQRETGKPSSWRSIATANGITDPLAFPTFSDLGRTLIIPDMEA